MQYPGMPCTGIMCCCKMGVERFVINPRAHSQVWKGRAAEHSRKIATQAGS